MTLLPVIERELRASARHPFTYYLRTFGVAAMLLTCLLFGLDHWFESELGGMLFGYLHVTLFWAILILAPLLTADCLSRERREGTLGLLFLTHLTAIDIVVAKASAHGIRAMTLWLAVLPVMTIPFLMGGLSWNEALLSSALTFGAICTGLAAGLLASAWSKSRLRALLMAAILEIILVLLTVFVFGEVLLTVVSPGWTPDYTALAGLELASKFLDPASVSLNMIPRSGLILMVGEASILPMLLLLLVIVCAGAKTRRVWQDQPPSKRQLWLEKTFTTPMFWRSFYGRWMRHKLEGNPVGWLEQRTWSSRLVTWSWLAVIVSVYSLLLTELNFNRDFGRFLTIIAWLLIGSLAASAAGSFRRERESGVLELLLVSTLGEKAIISGRLRGLWGKFLPSFGLFLAIWAYIASLLPDESNGEAISFCAISFLTLPVIGLYFSLSCRNLITALSFTLALGLLVPSYLPAFISSFLAPGPLCDWSSGPASTLQIAFALFLFILLHDRLKKRTFSFERMES